MGSEPSFSVVEPERGLGLLWRSLADLRLFGWLGNLWFTTLADTEAGRSQVKQAAEDHEALKATRPYAQVLQAILDDPQYRLVDQEPALGEQVLIHAACFDATWTLMRGAAVAQARFLRLYCVSRFKPFRQAYTFDLASNEITRHALPGGQWHREVPYALW
ncbi:hypothetical protein [Geothrix fermentans]|uniref:hypothetical protein n=1 Tax=Geothrix fermentans TaxID=44676 RepID=UPI00042A5920|nr:hypothetical protein [Geothrix fermentans]